MNKHTPGPWKDTVNEFGALVTIAADPASFICYIGGVEDTEGEDHANARLIAAAPELLAACEFGNPVGESVLRRAAALLTSEYPNVASILWCKADAEEAAIAKVKGDTDA